MFKFYTKLLTVRKKQLNGTREKARTTINIWDKVFMNGPSKICRRQPFKNLK